MDTEFAKLHLPGEAADVSDDDDGGLVVAGVGSEFRQQVGVGFRFQNGDGKNTARERSQKVRAQARSSNPDGQILAVLAQLRRQLIMRFKTDNPGCWHFVFPSFV